MSDSFATPWTVARQAPLLMGFPRQECRSGLPFPLPGNLPNLGTERASPASQEDSLPLSHEGGPRCGNKQALILRVAHVYLGPEAMSQNMKKKRTKRKNTAAESPS